MEQERVLSGTAATKSSPTIAFKESGPPSEKPAAGRAQEPVRQDGAGSLIAKLYITNRPRGVETSFAASKVAHRSLECRGLRSGSASCPAAPQADARSCAIKHVMRFQMAWLRRRGGAG
eukprot:tig00000654_g2800.t1